MDQLTTLLPGGIAGALAILAVGVVAGFFNVTAGGGSLLTLPLLVLLGLPSPVANGTNRVAIVIQNLVAVPTFRHGGVRGLRRALPLVLLALPGTVLGAWAGVVVSDALFRRVIAVTMVVLAGVVLLSRRPVGGQATGERPFRPWTLAAFALLGFYAGFIQAGIGFFIVFALAGLERFPLVRAHAFKVTVVLALQCVALPVFALGGMVRWIPGLVLAVGLSLGGFLGARMALRSSERFLRVLLGFAAVALAIKLLLS